MVGPACISLADAEGRQRVSISLDEDGAPSLQLWNENRQAIVLLILALSDQFTENIVDNLDQAWSLLPRLADEYLQAYYQGILFERQARVYMRRAAPGSHFSAYDLFREAMRLYEKAENVRPPGNDEALLRWNTCARAIMAGRLEARPFDDFRPMLE